MKKLSIIIGLSLLLYSCGVSKKCKVFCGKFLHEERTLDTLSNKLIIPKYHKDSKIWIMDSLVIEEIMGVNIVRDENGKETFDVIPERYTFINLKNKSIYEFSSFSDTAHLLAKYSEKNSRGKRNWLFFKYSDSLEFKDIQKLSDSVIDNYTFTRYQISKEQIRKEKSESRVLYRYYTDCREKNIFLTFHKRISENTNCAVLKSDIIYIDAKIFYHHNLVKQSSNLSYEELKVFNAWKKYSILNPVTQ